MFRCFNNLFEKFQSFFFILIAQFCQRFFNGLILRNKNFLLIFLFPLTINPISTELLHKRNKIKLLNFFQHLPLKILNFKLGMRRKSKVLLINILKVMLIIAIGQSRKFLPPFMTPKFIQFEPPLKSNFPSPFFLSLDLSMPWPNKIILKSPLYLALFIVIELPLIFGFTHGTKK